MTIDIPRGRIVPVNNIALCAHNEPHPFEVASLAAVEANWSLERADNPALFDGRLMLFSGLTLSGDGVLQGRGHAVRYATFLHWRRLRPLPDVEHVFANAVLVSSDGALVLARMVSSTANPGQAYFASGSFEPEDVVGGEIDVVANMRREVQEEIGIDLTDASPERGYHFLSQPTGNVLFRRYVLAERADVIAERIRSHVTGQSDPEVAEPVIVRSIKVVPQRMASHMPALIAWHFSG